MLSGISHYHPQWPVGSGGCSAIECIGLVPPRKHVLWGSGLRDWEEVMLSQCDCARGLRVSADMPSLSVNQRVLSLPFPGLVSTDSTGCPWPQHSIQLAPSGRKRSCQKDPPASWNLGEGDLSLSLLWLNTFSEPRSWVH